MPTRVVGFSVQFECRRGLGVGHLRINRRGSTQALRVAHVQAHNTIPAGDDACRTNGGAPRQESKQEDSKDKADVAHQNASLGCMAFAVVHV